MPTESIPLTLRKSDHLGDWYLIERRDHDGRSWSEPVEYGTRCCNSRRLIPHSCIEGTAEEMLDIADAIEQRDTSRAKRCAVHVHTDDCVEFWSPRNSNGVMGVVTLANADALAAEIRATLAATP